MPLPWKKSKVNRISRFVADLHSPKHGGSLVVETGFPTSLIDLFHKNRDRLKKHSKRHRNSKIEIPELPPPPSPPSLKCSPERSSGDWIPVSEIVRNCEVEEIDYDYHPLVKEREEEEEAVVSGGDMRLYSTKSKVFMAILKMFFVIVLALGTKKLAVGITVSAFVLLFVEYIGNYFGYFMKPCSNAKSMIEASIHSVLPFVRSNRETTVKEKEKVVSSACGSIERIECEALGKEIQIVESSIDRIEEEVQILKNIDMDCVDRNMDQVFMEIEAKKIVMEKHESRREGLKRRLNSAKLKAKTLKKFMTTKFHKERKGKEKGAESSSDVSSSMGEIEEIKEIQGPKEVEESTSKSNERVEKVVNDEICCLSETSHIERDIRKLSKKGDSGYIIVVLVVLVGLVGGKIWASVLTVAWCVMLKQFGSSKSLINFPN